MGGSTRDRYGFHDVGLGGRVDHAVRAVRAVRARRTSATTSRGTASRRPRTYRADAGVPA
jgi:hypothetical protein